MSEILKKRVKEHNNREVTIFLKNNFRYTGKIIDIDDFFLELKDSKTGEVKVFAIAELKEIVFGVLK